MTENSKDEGVITVLLQRLEQQRLPRLLDLKEKVGNGEVLNDFDIEYLSEVFADAEKVKPLIDRHPEYSDMVTKMVSLYKEITEKALENENKS